MRRLNPAMKKRRLSMVAFAALCGTALLAQNPTPPPLPPMAADASPSFEVATIRSSKATRPGKRVVPNRRSSTENTSLGDLITFAYAIHPKQIVGAPGWTEEDNYDLAAEPDVPGQPSFDQTRIMVQKLLTDRFRLVFHHDKREFAVYTITIGNTGSKLTQSKGNPNGPPSVLGFQGRGRMIARNANLAEVAGVLQASVLDKPVLDQTGLARRWDFTLNWTPDPTELPNFSSAPTSR
jgi:uncharacterized protein (TIGR03435 family)